MDAIYNESKVWFLNGNVEEERRSGENLDFSKTVLHTATALEFGVLDASRHTLMDPKAGMLVVLGRLYDANLATPISLITESLVETASKKQN